ncbi:hypothetical protein PSTT_03573 [Puccinia striiformis]|uniref:porphobilinogen synthase n=1 Tax=Puccinia striiformis TaxID=27350 RepID=A0A2S4VVU0_9BASI|nr:hypothetical protein PSTT_03573 [Puccinia striiformis]
MSTQPSTTATPLSHVLQGGYAHPLTRSLQAERTLTKEMLMFPIFISDDPNAQQPIDSFPNQFRQVSRKKQFTLGLNVLEGFIRPFVEKGLRSVMLFGVPMNCQKDAVGTPADDENGPTISAIRLLKEKFPSLFVAADVCLCEYTDHGHCGFAPGQSGGEIDTPASVARIAAVALSYARAGADCVAPSDMMDGRIGAIKQALIDARLANRCCLMSYSAKFASALYGPFRAAACSAPSLGDRKGYQLPPNARGLAKRAIVNSRHFRRADIIMVKPAQTYLDVVSEARSLAPSHPLACYQVSGEYAALLAGADAGVYELKLWSSRL